MGTYCTSNILLTMKKTRLVSLILDVVTNIFQGCQELNLFNKLCQSSHKNVEGSSLKYSQHIRKQSILLEETNFNAAFMF